MDNTETVYSGGIFGKANTPSQAVVPPSPQSNSGENGRGSASSSPALPFKTSMTEFGRVISTSSNNVYKCGNRRVFSQGFIMVGMGFYGMADAGCLKTKNAWATSAHPTLLRLLAHCLELPFQILGIGRIFGRTFGVLPMLCNFGKTYAFFGQIAFVNRVFDNFACSVAKRHFG